MIGSYVPDGIAVSEWIIRHAQGVKCFYDIDTPVTLARLENGNGQYVAKELIPNFDLYLSFTGGPILDKLAKDYGARMPRAFYCSFDPELYSPGERRPEWDLGYMGTYSRDRQEALDRLLLEPARRWTAGKFVVAGPLYPTEIAWPANVQRTEHVHPAEHRKFYLAQKFTLNITRADMIRAGFSQRATVRGSGLCHSHNQRLLGGHRGIFRDRQRDPYFPVGSRDSGIHI